MTEQTLIDKLHRLPPERLNEVADFVDFLSQQHELESNLHLTKSVTTASVNAFAKVWDNPEDAVYDNLSVSELRLA